MTALAETRAVPTHETVVDLLGSIIAESRYQAWDAHAQGPNAMSWREYREHEPTVACNIYLADGRRDAEALLPYVQGAINQAAVKALRDVAAELAAAEDPSAVAIVTSHANRLDWRTAGEVAR